jgi:hypothetical protein
MVMTCISTPEPEERLLMAFLDGEADPKLTFHLQQCPHCRKRVETLRREQQLLTSSLFRISCPSAAQLGEYHLHLLPPAQMLVISRHLRECPYCNREIDQLKEFLTDLAPGSEGSLLQKTKLLIAQLVSGPGVSAPAGEPSFALRGENEGPMTFEVEGILIVIDFQKTNDGKLTLLGQLAADQQDDWTDASVNLNQEGQPVLSTKVDDLGAFRLGGILPGLVGLQIEARDGTIVMVPTFENSV